MERLRLNKCRAHLAWTNIWTVDGGVRALYALYGGYARVIGIPVSPNLLPWGDMSRSLSIMD